MLGNAAKKLLTEIFWKCIIISRENEYSAFSEMRNLTSLKILEEHYEKNYTTIH